MLLGSYIAGIVLLLALPLVFVTARFVSKRSKVPSWTLDDTLLVLALVENSQVQL